MNYENIVIAIDGSKASEKPSTKPSTLQKQQMQLVLTHIVDTRTFATAEAYDKSLSERAEKYARDLLNEYVENEEAGVENVESVLKYGSPKVAIAKEVAPKTRT